MDDEKDETHIDNLLSMFGAKPESNNDNSQAPTSGNAGRGVVNPPVVNPNAPYPSMTKPITPESMIPYAGGAAGAISRYKGFGGNLLSPAPGLFSPQTPTAAPSMAPYISNTSIPSQDQAARILAGGEGDTLETTGRQRGTGYNAETQRMARVQQAIEGSHGNVGTFRDPIVTSGPMVPTKSGIQIPIKASEEQMMLDAQRKVEATRQAQQAAADAAAKEASAARMAQLTGVAKGVGKIGLGALGGALSANEGYQAVKDALAKGEIDWPTARHMMSAAGGLAMMVPSPFGVSTAAGLALQAPEAYHQIREAIK